MTDMKRIDWKRTASIGAVTLVVAACAGSGAETTTTSTLATLTTLAPPPSPPQVDLTALPDWFVDEDAAPADLVSAIGEELGADYMGSMAVEWPTGGLGCSTGGNDLQVITPGYVIFYRVDEDLVRIHASESGNWKPCELSRPLEGIPVLTS